MLYLLFVLCSIVVAKCVVCGGGVGLCLLYGGCWMLVGWIMCYVSVWAGGILWCWCCDPYMIDLGD